jgi:hypothetical protein
MLVCRLLSQELTSKQRYAPFFTFEIEYINAVRPKPGVIMAAFLFVGSVFFLYIKARLGPGPFLFASIFGCICIGAHLLYVFSIQNLQIADISFTTGVLFPYAYYKVTESSYL